METNQRGGVEGDWWWYCLEFDFVQPGYLGLSCHYCIMYSFLDGRDVCSWAMNRKALIN
jgi:hypothetical protein